MLDVQGMISELGVPIAMSLAMMWGCFYLIKYITGQHTTMMNTKFEYLTGIIVKLIDQQKLMQMDLKSWSSNTQTLVDFLKEERDNEQQRLIQKAKNRNL
jgi:dihydroxyacetone kinase DhaKLM complex PTS-EIIA-like component DhaM